MRDPHILQMNKSDAHGGLWCSCSCGWKTPIMPIPPGDDPQRLALALSKQGIAHRDAVTALNGGRPQ